MRTSIFTFLFIFLVVLGCKNKSPKEIVEEIKSREIYENNKSVAFSDTTQTAFSNLKIKDEKFRKEITAEVQKFYQQNGYTSRWLFENKPSPLFYSYLEVLENSKNYGLNPQTYRKDELNSSVEKLFSEELSLPKIEELDKDITASFLLLAKHLGSGRIAKLGDNTHIWRKTKFNRDDVEILLKLKENENLTEVIHALHPQHPLYQRMSEKYKELSQNNDEVIKNVAFPNLKDFKIGYKDSAVIALRHNLKSKGYNTENQINSNIVDSILMAKIAQFQTDKGIKPDGIPGKNTLYYLNMTTAQQRDLLLLNMERIRWLNNDLGDNYVIVNVPDFKLTMYHKDTIVFQTNVIVGAEYTPTPIIIDTIKYVEFRPTWTVPQSIIRKEMIPQIIAEKNPTKYQKRGYKLYENGKEIDPNSVNWQDPNLNKRVFHFVEAPSERNSLGLVKFILTNDLSIYLHDTASPRLFSRQDRALSHGCIRIEKPAEFAYHLLKNQDNWTQEKVLEAMQGGKNQHRIRLKTKYLVDFLYITAWVDENNEIIIKNDIYGFDQEQLKELKKY